MTPDHPAAPQAVAPREARYARAARLEARLAVYAQYAAVVAEQAAAVAGGNAERAAALADERERVAEHYAELQDAVGTGAPSFRAALEEALAELAHQGAVDVALAQRLVSLRDAVVRGAAWAASGTAGPARLALPAPDAPAADTSDAHASPEPREGDDALGTTLGNALVAARAAQVGGALAGHFPGRGGRDEWPAGWPASDTAAEAPAGPRLDVRF